MEIQDSRTFAEGLRNALAARRLTQAELARRLSIDPGQVSRWATGRATPRADMVGRIEEKLGARFPASISVSTPLCELFVAAPITGLAPSTIASHREAVALIVAAARQHVDGIYWPGERVASSRDLLAADIATERQLKVLAGCDALLFLQFDEITRPSGSLIELGFALGRRTKTTIIHLRGVQLPNMLDGFAAVAESMLFLPKARIYAVDTVEDAVALVTMNGRELLGLPPQQSG